MTQPFKVCPQCQTPAELTTSFCSNCGRDLRTQFIQPAMPPTSFSDKGMAEMAQGRQYAPVPQDINNKRVVAGILGILLGGLGIHKFMLGKTQAGIIMFLVSLLSCGLAAPIMHLLGLVEGILYLSKSDTEFYQTYIVGNKEWL